MKPITAMALTVFATCCRGAAGEPASPGAGYEWYSAPIEVSGQPPGNAAFLPVSAEVDFTALLDRVAATNAVDTRTLRLYRVDPAGKIAEQPYQFTPTAQTRSRTRKLLPGTRKEISYLAEYAAGERPQGRVGGVLTWLAGGNSGTYRLDFGLPVSGRRIQVPYAPHDLHTFDASNRAAEPRWFPRMQIRPQQPFEGGVTILDAGQLVTKYHTGPTDVGSPAPSPYRRPFLYPVNGPDGVSLTEFGKPHDPSLSHAHHYSLWIAHANVNGADFWGEKGGTIVHEQFEELEDGPLYCLIRQRARWTFGSTNVLRETRTITIHRGTERVRAMDFLLELTPFGSNAVTFGKTSFGFLAARVAQSMTPFDGGGEIVNANGARNEQAVHLERANWLDQSGPIAQDKWGGIAILDHPDNPGFPTVWHCRNDGWAGAAFNADRQFILNPRQVLRLRYRVLLHSGNAADAGVAGLFKEWVTAPSARVGKPSRM